MSISAEELIYTAFFNGYLWRYALLSWATTQLLCYYMLRSSRRKDSSIVFFFGMLHRDKARKLSNGAIYQKSVEATCGYMMIRTFPLSWKIIQALGCSKMLEKGVIDKVYQYYCCLFDYTSYSWSSNSVAWNYLWYVVSKTVFLNGTIMLYRRHTYGYTILKLLAHSLQALCRR